jgi:hypothetical protein
MIKGIGPHFAGRLVAAFGEAVFDVSERTPQRLPEVDGIGKTRLGRITAGWSEQKAIREIMVVHPSTPPFRAVWLKLDVPHIEPMSKSIAHDFTKARSGPTPSRSSRAPI